MNIPLEKVLNGAGQGRHADDEKRVRGGGNGTESKGVYQYRHRHNGTAASHQAEHYADEQRQEKQRVDIKQRKQGLAPFKVNPIQSLQTQRNRSRYQPRLSWYCNYKSLPDFSVGVVLILPIDILSN